ncbi:unnamed protein product [Coregonus sp. 'balchen']|nr:unnamed protein product [Coregonus sp. 'balchen']
MDVKMENEKEISQANTWSNTIDTQISYPYRPTTTPHETTHVNTRSKAGSSDGEIKAVKGVYFCENQDASSTSEEHLIKDGMMHRPVILR